MTTATSFYDEELSARTAAVEQEALRLLVDSPALIQVGGGRYHAVVVAAPAGAGKSEFVCTSVSTVVERSGGRPGTAVVATPTNHQAQDLVRRLAARLGPRHTVAFIRASTAPHLPPATLALPNVVEAEARQADHYSVTVGTLAKLGDAYGRGSVGSGFGYLVMDEAYQADSAHYYGVASLARRHLLVGDPGQLDPFTTMEDGDRWRGFAEDPVQTAVGAILGNHPNVPVVRLPITRRLPASAVPVVAAFYPEHRFSSWTVPGARTMGLRHAGLGRGALAAVDAAVDHAATEGWAYLRLPSSPVLTADPATVEVITSVAQRLRDRAAQVSSERTEGRQVDLDLERVAVAVSHRDQRDQLRASLDDAGLQQVRVDTANRLQGLDFDVVIAWHPLAGLPAPDGFHLDPGRLCVQLTRHRHACVVVGRAGDVEVLQSVPQIPEAWLGEEASPEVDGWFAHRFVFDRLDDHAFDIR